MQCHPMVTISSKMLTRFSWAPITLPCVTLIHRTQNHLTGWIVCLHIHLLSVPSSPKGKFHGSRGLCLVNISTLGPGM